MIEVRNSFLQFLQSALDLIIFVFVLLTAWWVGWFIGRMVKSD